MINLYGKKSPLLADFGFAPTPRAAPAVETKQQAALKRAATRVARHTMGKKATVIGISDEHRSRTVELRAVA